MSYRRYLSLLELFVFCSISRLNVGKTPLISPWVFLNIFCSRWGMANPSRLSNRTNPTERTRWRGQSFPGLRIRIDLIRIRIQQFCSIRIRIQAKTEFSKTISFSNFFEIKIWVKSNKKYRCYSSKFFFKKYLVSAILYRYLFCGKICYKK
jgi:hypothetical protein